MTFLTTRTSTGSKVDVFHQSQPLTQSSDVTHAVRVVKNVTCLSSLLLFCTNVHLTWRPFDMVNSHYVIIDFRAKFFIKIQNQASDTSRSLPSFSSAPFLLRAVPSERLGQVYFEPCIRQVKEKRNRKKGQYRIRSGRIIIWWDNIISGVLIDNSSYRLIFYLD